MLQQQHTNEEIEQDARHTRELGRLHQVQALQAEAIQQQAAYLSQLCTAHERQMGMEDSDDDLPPPQQTTQTAASSSPQQTAQPAQTAGSQTAASSSQGSQQTAQPALYSPPPPLDQLPLHNPWPGPAPPPGRSSGAPQRGA